jgi:F0F1-type ATP synthase beta subunit
VSTIESQTPLTHANNFIVEGVLVDLKDTIRSFKAIMNGEGDDLPEGAFYMGKFYQPILLPFHAGILFLRRVENQC